MESSLYHSLTHHRRRWTIAFFVWLCVVWGHSLMSGEASSAESSGVVDVLRPLFALFGVSDQHVMSFVVRKTAHFSEYAILGGLGLRMAVAWFGATKRAIALACGILLVVPCVDEAIQLLVPGRAGMSTDILIDMAGGALGLLACWLCISKRQWNTDSRKRCAT